MRLRNQPSQAAAYSSSDDDTYDTDSGAVPQLTSDNYYVFAIKLRNLLYTKGVWSVTKVETPLREADDEKQESVDKYNRGIQICY